MQFLFLNKLKAEMKKLIIINEIFRNFHLKNSYKNKKKENCFHIQKNKFSNLIYYSFISLLPLV